MHSGKKKIVFSRKVLFMRLCILGLIIIPILIFFMTQRHSPKIIPRLKPTFQAKVSYVQTPTAKIAYYTRGKGEPLILLPGFGMTMQDWDPLLLQKLATKNKLIIIDFRGVGSSTGELDKLTEKQIAADIIAAMDKLQIKKAHIVGWSLGSFVGQLIAENYPARVDKLVLISTSPGQDQQIEASKAIGDAIQNNLDGGWEDVYVPLLFYSDKAKDDYLSRVYAARERQELPTISVENIDAKLAYEKAFGQPAAEEARTALLATIKAPTLLITGEQDTLLVPENAKRVAKRIPHAKLVLIPQAGHAVLFEKVAEVSQEISAFLTEK